MAKKETQSIPLTYRDAGVDIDAGDALVDAIKPAARRTNRAGANPKLGGFGGLFDLKAAGYCDPILVAATDGVGTKLELAQTVGCLLYTSPSPRDRQKSRMPSSA